MAQRTMPSYPASKPYRPNLFLITAVLTRAAAQSGRWRALLASAELAASLPALLRLATNALVSLDTGCASAHAHEPSHSITFCVAFGGLP